MSTHFYGEGNVGSIPEYREFPHGNEEPRRLLRLNVYFDNLMLKKDGEYEDRGGFWAPVELWRCEAEHWKTLYRKGMRVLVEGRVIREEWEDGLDRASRETRAGIGRNLGAVRRCLPAGGEAGRGAHPGRRGAGRGE
jgi:single-strand DNA-binding protein